MYFMKYAASASMRPASGPSASRVIASASRTFMSVSHADCAVIWFSPENSRADRESLDSTKENSMPSNFAGAIFKPWKGVPEKTVNSLRHSLSRHFQTRLGCNT